MVIQWYIGENFEGKNLYLGGRKRKMTQKVDIKRVNSEIVQKNELQKVIHSLKINGKEKF